MALGGSKKKGRLKLIDRQELEELSHLYGRPERERYTLRVSRETLAYWEEKTAHYRGEVIPVFQRPEGQVLLHTKEFYPAGLYRLPSGGIRREESVLAALRREIWEETGLQAEVERFLGLLEYEFRLREEGLPPAGGGRRGAEPPLIFASYLFLLEETAAPPKPQDREEKSPPSALCPGKRWKRRPRPFAPCLSSGRSGESSAPWPMISWLRREDFPKIELRCLESSKKKKISFVRYIQLILEGKVIEKAEKVIGKIC